MKASVKLVLICYHWVDEGYSCNGGEMGITYRVSFVTGTPLKVLSTGKLIWAMSGISRMIYVDIDSQKSHKNTLYQMQLWEEGPFDLKNFIANFLH